MAEYLAVIGNLEYLKLYGRRIGIWELLEYQPGGWLRSLAFKQSLILNTSILWDCGAYSYRYLDIPKLKGNLVTPKWAIHEYKEHSRLGDIVVAPDSLLLGNNINQRRKFNYESAARFIELAAELEGRLPMAVVHGLTVEERLKRAVELYNLGYKALGIGGLVPEASNKRHNIQIVGTVVEELQKLPEKIWIHVFGLSAPEYAKAFHQLRVTSFDSASHFKEAFLAGSFFLAEGERLIKYKAVKPGEIKTAPLCSCLCCQTLRKAGIDTRRYGSNHNNKGRAIHNLNQLIIAQKNAMTECTIYFVSCVKQKLSHPAPAQDMYISQWFKAARRYVESIGTEWYILSAKHGVISPTTILEPYNQTLNQMSAQERLGWAGTVMAQLQAIAPDGTEVVFLAGRLYRETLIPQLIKAGYTIRVPMEKLGIGEQLAWLSQNTPKIKCKQLSLF